FKDISTMCHFKALHDVLFDQQKGNALPIDTLKQRKQLFNQKGRQTERRLVENKKNGFGHQAASNRQHLLLAARQAAGSLRLSLGKARKNAEYPLAILPPAAARAAVGPEIEIVLHAEIWKYAATFRNVNESSRHYTRWLLPLD